jgi:hypothetical protein
MLLQMILSEEEEHPLLRDAFEGLVLGIRLRYQRYGGCRRLIGMSIGIRVPDSASMDYY